MRLVLSGKLCFNSRWPVTNVTGRGERITELDCQGEQGRAESNRQIEKKNKKQKTITITKKHDDNSYSLACFYSIVHGHCHQYIVRWPRNDISVQYFTTDNILRIRKNYKYN